jgi:hypothetical protein
VLFQNHTPIAVSSAVANLPNPLGGSEVVDVSLLRPALLKSVSAGHLMLRENTRPEKAFSGQYAVRKGKSWRVYAHSRKSKRSSRDTPASGTGSRIEGG